MKYHGLPMLVIFASFSCRSGRSLFDRREDEIPMPLEPLEMSNCKGCHFTATLLRTIVAWHCCLIASILAVSVATAADAASPSTPNVLFIAVDDLRPELGCYGKNAIQSPNIDKLASSGVVFNRAYCQLAVCNPSRVSIMTGLRPDSTKVWGLATRFCETVPNVVTLPQQFKKHGYHAVSYGKVFHNPWPDNESWSEPHHWPKKSSLWSDDAKKRRATYKERMRADGASDIRISIRRVRIDRCLEISIQHEWKIAAQIDNRMSRFNKSQCVSLVR